MSQQRSVAKHDPVLRFMRATGLFSMLNSIQLPMSLQKLELTWIGKEKRPRLEPRILLEDSGKSYYARHRVSDQDIFDNRLIFGDKPFTWTQPTDTL